MKKIEKKLSLNKQLIANLNTKQLTEIKGGGTDSWACPTTTSRYCYTKPNPGTTISADC